GALLGILLTAVTLPGTWLAVLFAGVVVLIQRDSMHWGYLVGGVGLCVAGEIAEFVASAAGATKAGGSRASAIGSILGALVGALAGTIVLGFLPIVGTIVGAAAGAGLGAIIGERGHAQRPWKESFAVGRGAAVGRLLSVVIKTGIAVVLAVVLILGAWV
ncbi:MAG: DUF456 domain-containing protein, partial [Salinibacterium sp.]|nr:DUF456 domain-containing protein [Salinibacterium sp.]